MRGLRRKEWPRVCLKLPLYEAASTKLARKTHVDIMNKVQVNIYAAGLHRQGSGAVHRYTMMELADRFALMNVAFDQEDFRVDEKLEIIPDLIEQPNFGPNR